MQEIKGDRERFFRDLEARLVQGAKEYGDASFAGPVSSTLGEIEEEFLDVAGWGYIGWVKIQRLRERISNISRRISGENQPDILPGQSVFSDGVVVNRTQYGRKARGG
jgi:hypothetical protein